jgi:hypothetical protein
MKPIVIKFSHRYLKMKDGFEKSTLLDVISVKLEDLSVRFLEFDTVYIDEKGNTEHYLLPKKGNYMILLLQNWTPNYGGSIWTTIRSQKGRGGLDKMDYYKSHIGEVVECQVTK